MAHARHRLEPRQQIRRERDTGRRRGVVCAGERDPERQQVIGGEPGSTRDSLTTLFSIRPGRREQDDRQRDLRDHERCARAAPPIAEIVRPDAFS